MVRVGGSPSTVLFPVMRGSGMVAPACAGEMVEKLSEQVRRDLRLGLVTPTAARQMVRLPAGNQDEVQKVARRESLTAKELEGVIDSWMAWPNRSQKDYILEVPRRALCNAKGIASPALDPRLSAAGNRVSRRLGILLDLLARRHNGFAIAAVTTYCPRI